jgi:hypothetical protein
MMIVKEPMERPDGGFVEKLGGQPNEKGLDFSRPCGFPMTVLAQ